MPKSRKSLKAKLLAAEKRIEELEYDLVKYDAAYVSEELPPRLQKMVQLASYIIHGAPDLAFELDRAIAQYAPAPPYAPDTSIEEVVPVLQGHDANGNALYGIAAENLERGDVVEIALNGGPTQPIRKIRYDESIARGFPFNRREDFE